MARMPWGKRNKYGAVKTRGFDSKTEAAYAEFLQTLRMTGDVKEFYHHPMKFKLAPSTHFEPDFLVVLPDGNLEFHEVKGFRTPAGRVKLKLATQMFPMFRWFEVTRDAGNWAYEEIAR